MTGFAVKKTAAVQPGPAECLTWCAAMLLSAVLVAWATRGYLAAVLANGDNDAYAHVSDALVQGTWESIGTAKHFWGTSYLAAGLRLVLGISSAAAIGVASFVSALASTFLVHKLWSGWIALYFVAANYSLIQMGAYGGADPIFLFFMLLFFYLARRDNGPASAFAAAVASTVRPLGIFALADLLWRSRFSLRRAALALVIAVGVGLLYVVPLLLHFQNPLVHWSAYQREDWQGNLPVSFPLAAVVGNLFNGQNTGNVAMVAVKLGYVCAHVAAIFGIAILPARRTAFLRSPERMTAALYSIFLLTYNAPTWALSIYPRLLLPLTPLMLDAFADWLPHRRRVAALMGTGSLFIAVGANLGFSGSYQLLRQLWK